MPEKMRESNLNEGESLDWAIGRFEDEGDPAVRKPLGSGLRLWDRVRSSLLKPKVKSWRWDTLLLRTVTSYFLFNFHQRCVFLFPGFDYL